MSRLRWWHVVAVASALLATLSVLLFFLGGPQRPDTTLVESSPVASSPSDASSGVSGAPVQAPLGTPSPDGSSSDQGGALPWDGGTGVQPEGGVEMPLIPIPGCRCHSDDPAVIEEHSRYSLADCADCH